MKRFAFVTLLGLGATLLSSCGGGRDDNAASSSLRVIASFYPLAEAASRVGGEVVEVANLTPAGTEPHDLELTTDQVDALEDADLVLYLGHEFQPGVAEIAERRDGEALDLLDEIDVERGAIDALESEHGDEAHGDDHDDEVDPHFWLDPRLMVQAVDAIEAALSAAAPDHAASFAANADAYRDELAALDAEMADGLSSCARDEIVTSHAAFYYLAQRYGLTQLAIGGLSPEAEPDPARLAELADQIEADGITTVFYETLVTDDVADTLAREAGVTTAVLNPLEGLTKSQVADGADYAGVMRDNLAALMLALGCR